MNHKLTVLALSALLAVSIAGCSGNKAQSEFGAASVGSGGASSHGSGAALSSAVSGSTESEAGAPAGSGESGPESLVSAQTELTVRFGDDGEPFSMNLYDNPTAAAIAAHVGTADWRLPIYNYNDYENWEVMQFYDIPSRYEIPSDPEAVTEEKAGEVYYSHPNRIVLFYGDAAVTGDYTPVGYFEPTDVFVSAVENNPVLEGWSNKIVNISDGE